MLLTPRLDIVFKLLFTKDTDMLADLINCMLSLSGNRRIMNVTVLNPVILPDEVLKKYIILDIRARDGRKHEYDIEMQAQKYDIYPKRALYYLCKIYANQLESGENYGELRPVSGIHFLDYAMFEKNEDFHFHFMLKDIRHPELELNEDISMHIFELPKIRKIFRKMAVRQKTEMEEWLYFFNNAEKETEETMAQNYTNPMVLRAYDILESLSADQQTRMIAEAREMAILDERSILASAEKKGVEKGRNEGRDESKKEMAHKLRSMGILTKEQISKITGFSVQDIEKLTELPDMEIIPCPDTAPVA
jgi:predicted transposase/invertase (TIGR01784 family)